MQPFLIWKVEAVIVCETSDDGNKYHLVSKRKIKVACL